MLSQPPLVVLGLPRPFFVLSVRACERASVRTFFGATTRQRPSYLIKTPAEQKEEEEEEGGGGGGGGREGGGGGGGDGRAPPSNNIRRAARRRQKRDEV